MIQLNQTCSDTTEQVKDALLQKIAKIDQAFTYHPPKPGQPEKYAAIRDKAKEFATLLAMMCPDSRELSLAMTNLEQAVMWANASIHGTMPASRR
jgi:hypothetical protein